MLRIIQDRLNNEIEEKWMYLIYIFFCLERRRILSLVYIEYDICSMRRQLIRKLVKKEKKKKNLKENKYYNRIVS